ncbi:MAG: DUF433 domain-containing protein [Pseudonocardiaceae bacterium]
MRLYERGTAISLLHRPVYTYPQVDRLLGLTSGTARRWINGYRHGHRAYEPITRPESRNTTWVTWGEYVEARLLANWRDLDRFPIPKLRRLAEYLRRETGEEFPLATYAMLMRPEGKTVVWQAQQFADLPEDLAVEVITGQIVWTSVVGRLVEAADFGPDTTPDGRRMVAELTADEDFPLIKLDVRRRGGQPVIQGRNVRASTIAELVAAGESRGDVAEWYDLSAEQIDQAVGYYRRHLRIA